MPDTFYEPLKKSVSILVIDDDPSQLDFYEEMISIHPLFSVKKASSAREAANILQSSAPIHLSILDCGIDDIGGDEFYLLRKYSRKLPFVIISGSADMERAFEATNLGAAGMIAKPPELNSSRFWDTLAEVFLDKTILPDLSAAVNTQLNECCKIIRKNLPETVSDWAAQANITDAYLRRIWSECMAFPPKHILFLYTVYKKAFEFYNTLYLSEVNSSGKHPPVPDQMEHRRVMNYYLLNKRELDGIRDKLRASPALPSG